MQLFQSVIKQQNESSQKGVVDFFNEDDESSGTPLNSHVEETMEHVPNEDSDH